MSKQKETDKCSKCGYAVDRYCPGVFCLGGTSFLCKVCFDHLEKKNKPIQIPQNILLQKLGISETMLFEFLTLYSETCEQIPLLIKSVRKALDDDNRETMMGMLDELMKLNHRLLIIYGSAMDNYKRMKHRELTRSDQTPASPSSSSSSSSSSSGEVGVEMQKTRVEEVYKRSSPLPYAPS